MAHIAVDLDPRQLHPGAPDVWTTQRELSARLLDEHLPADLTNIVLHYLPIVIPRGQFRRTIGSKGSADGQFKEPRGVAVWQEFLLVADSSNCRVSVHQLPSGAFVRHLGLGILTPGLRSVTASDGFAFASDQALGIAVFRFDDGLLVRQFDCQAGTCITAANGRLYVVSTAFVQVFAFDGTALHSIGLRQLHQPHCVAVYGGVVYVTDSSDRVSTFAESDGSFLRHIGANLAHPYGIAVHAGWVAISDNVSDSVTVFSTKMPDGVVAHRWGSRGCGDTELHAPHELCWTGELLVVADTFNHRIVLYE